MGQKGQERARAGKFKQALTLLLLLASAAAGAKEMQKLPEPRRTVIAGRVENFEEQNLRVISDNMFDITCKDFVDLEADGGSFCVESDCLFAQEVNLLVGDRRAWVFVKPGDSIFVHLNMVTGKADFSGGEAVMSKEIDDWMNSPEGDIFGTTVDLENPREWLTENFASMAVRLAESGMSSRSQNWIMLWCKFMIANQLCALDDREKAWTLMTDKDLFDPWNRTNLVTNQYRYHITMAVMMKCYGFRTASGEDFLRQLLPLMHEVVPDPLLHDVVLWEWMKEAGGCNELTPAMLEMGREGFATPLFVRLFDEQTSERVQQRLATDTGGDVKLDKVMKFDSEELAQTALIDYLRERHAGKVVYIDVWATWCAPCVTAFHKSHPALHKQFEGRDVVFVNVCCQSEFKDWATSIAEHDIKGENYFLGADATARFMARYGLGSFPSCMIIAPDGTLTSHAPRPADAGNTIEKLLH